MANELFERIDRQIKDILADIKSGRVGLPDLQRPFVWKDNKVRDLLDSMMNGFPIGYVMLWSAPEGYQNANKIGTSDKAFKAPQDLVIDGQQRLTSLLAAMTGEEIKGKDFKTRRIRIALNPLDNKFEVWTQIIEKDPNWISDISIVFKLYESGDYITYIIDVTNQINDNRLKKGLEPLSDDEKKKIHGNIMALLSLRDYIIPTLRIKSIADEEQVAEIFKRVNSGGQNLNENNFIETLLAVYDNDVHDKIMKFCSDSRTPANNTSYNQIIEVDSSHIIRMTVGLGFSRARLSYAYKLLRGKDLETGETNEDIRIKNMKIFRYALQFVVDLNNWHAFLNLFNDAGYLKGSLLSSNYVVVFGYVLYLLGKYKYKVPAVELRKVITLWLFMTTVTSYYSTSPESKVENIFADLRNVNDAPSFITYLMDVIKLNLTDDFFRVKLPDNLNSSSASSPAWYGYLASINVLGYCMLFSNTPASKYWTAGVSGTKNSIDKHHIFPKNYLAKIGFSSDRDRNQIANFTYLDYGTNIDISDIAPSVYVPTFRAELGEEAYLRTCEENALPVDFYQMSYFDFLAERRKLMAELVRKAYLKLLQGINVNQ